jgi:hypothetical protein
MVASFVMTKVVIDILAALLISGLTQYRYMAYKSVLFKILPLQLVPLRKSYKNQSLREV